MAQAIIDTVGTTDTLAAGLAKANLNFTELYAAIAALAALSGKGVTGSGDVVLVASPTLTPAANNIGLSITGQSLTGANAQSLLNLTGTWNTSGTPSAIKLNITDTASNAAALLLDLQIGGVGKFCVGKTGITKLGAFGPIDNNTAIWSDSQYWLYFGNHSMDLRSVSGSSFTEPTLRVGYGLGITNGYSNNTPNAYLMAPAAGTLQLGITHATTATNQTLKAHDVTTGTGADLILKGGSGSVAAGAVRFGTHAVIGGKTVTGYIAIKDEGGTVRYLAVVS